jgi:branched-chain amino acid transport system permease protein
MDTTFLIQNFFNFLMLGTIYAIVAIGFSLYFGVVDVIQFAHGDTIMLGAYGSLAGALVSQLLGIRNGMISLVIMLAIGGGGASAIGWFVGRYLVLPLRRSSPINVLLVTLMTGTAIREALRLFIPDGSNPKPFPMVLPDNLLSLGQASVRVSSVLILLAGILFIVLTQRLLTRTRLGLGIRAVAQDTDTAHFMGINFRWIIALTFVVGSVLAALAGLMQGLYYRQINTSMGVMLGIIGFCSAVVGGLGSLWGAVVGGFLFSALQISATVLLPIPSAYKDVFAFGAMICLVGLRPTGLIREKYQERV